MRLRELTLDFFGQFSGKRFDFGEGGKGSDFHIIHGPNEAGKTTTMEAYLRLLYGFPHHEPYAFLHQRRNLKVSGIFEVNGEHLLLSRLPKRAPNLVDASSNSLPEQAIAAHLGGLAEQDYRALLCLDDNTLETGGEDIANARGDIGRLLFSAAAGIADLNEVLAEIRMQADDIYRKRASKTRMAELKRELDKIDRLIREQDISVSTWRSLKSAAAAAVEVETVSREERNRIRRELEQARAMKRTLPWLEEHDRLMAEVVPFVDYPERLDIEAEELFRIEKDQARLLAEAERLRGECTKVKEELCGITVEPNKITLGDELDALDELRSRMQTAALDLPRRRRQLKEVMDDMRRSANELGLQEGGDVTQLALTSLQLEQLESAREALREASIKQENEARELDNLDKQLAEAKETLGRLQKDQPAIHGIGEILHRYNVEMLAPDVARAKEALARAGAEAEEALAKLAHGEIRFAELPACPMDIDTAGALADEHAHLKEELTAIEKDRASFLEEAEAKSARLELIAARGAVVPDNDAQAAREERDKLWQTHLHDLRQNSASAFERAMRAVDSIADARLAHASELAEIRQLELDRVEAEARARTVGERVADLTSKLEEIEKHIATAVASIGLQGIAPAGLVTWLERYQVAEEAQRRVTRVAAEHADVLRNSENLTQTLARLLDLEDPSFDAALAAARHLANEERQIEERLASAGGKVKELQRNRQRRAAQLTEADERLLKARQGWASLKEELFGDAVAPDVVLAELQTLRGLREQDLKRQQFLRQIETMEADQADFAARIEKLSNLNGIGDDDPLIVYTKLREIADRARKGKKRSEELQALIGQKEKQIREAEHQLEEIDQTVRLHAKQFPESHAAASIGELREAVVRASDIIESRERIANLEHQIVTELAISDIAAARALLKDTTSAELEARIGGCESDLDRAEDRLSAATEARATAARDLAAVTGEADIAALIQRRDTLLAEIEETALDFLELDLGLALAEDAIRRYRDTHRSAMIDATERAFRDLTNGAYTALRTQTDGKEEVLLAIDASGAAKQVGDMSKGTRFQLYLALRAAAYEQMAGQGVCLPFFCDDVFETFDEERTRAACRLMERISRSGQAIYLTHHRHVVEIAKEVCEMRPVIHEF